MLTVGQGDLGQLGLGPNVLARKRPALVQLPERIIQAEAGGVHTVCLSKTGKVSLDAVLYLFLSHLLCE